jgi:hypothetical protein
MPFRIGRTKRDNLIRLGNRPIITQEQSVGGIHMAANQVVLYFDKQEDAVLFTLAASSVVKVAEEICKASRITTEGVLNNS